MRSELTNTEDDAKQFDSLHEECGVFGIYQNQTAPVAASVYYGLYALQHRGQESCGMAICDDGVFRQYKGDGLVADVFTKKALAGLGEGNIAIGHVRYSTTGGKNANNIQPLVVRHIKGNLALVHNGNLTNAYELRSAFENRGRIFHGTSDTESIAYTLVEKRLRVGSAEEAIEQTMYGLKGAYSCIAMSATKMIAFRDPNGFRPLCLGSTPEGGYIVASESCAIDAVGGTFLRDIKPGEIVVIGKDGVRSIQTHCGKKGTICVFEYIYFARPDSVIEGASVHKARKRAGAFLAEESPVEADVVIGVPDSGIDAAIGYAERSGIPYGMGFIKNKYIGRSFIAPDKKQRENAVRIKLNVLKDTVKGKRVVMIDDSIVRGTTCARIVKLLREAGATEVHMRVSAPPFVKPCYFGTDVDSEENLIACKFDTVEKIAKEIGVDSLGYLSVAAAHKIAEGAACEFCDGCFTGRYPVDPPKEHAKDKFEEKIKR
ncbi:MAG: amidophosphoribosyltransferase [Clostridia bacterium]|nr:amidophosphoribosyltransferase [Clostridia bacterium]